MPHLLTYYNAMQTGADIVIKCLYENVGVREIFGYPGGAILPIYDALFRDGRIRHYLTRHEQAAGHAAEGYARSSGKVGVLFATSGPGATNTITALTDAYIDAIPLVCITGQVALSLIGTDAFQEADVVGLTRSCTKYNYLVQDVNDIPRIINEAFLIAQSGKPGPVLIDIPKDIQNQEFSGNIKDSKPRPIIERKCREIPVDIVKIRETVVLMKKAKRPVFYIGGGAVNSNAGKPILELLEKTRFPFTCTLMALDVVASGHKNYLRMLGMHGSIEANLAMYHADLIIAIGARFDDRVTGSIAKFSPNSAKVHIDIDASAINKVIKVDVALNGDAKSITEALLSEWGNAKSQDLSGWYAQIEKWRAEKSFHFEQKSENILPQYAISTISDSAQGFDPIFTTDVGQHQMWAAQYCYFTKPRSWLTSGGLGTMGYGLPAAVGAQIANPERAVICISGDASILMNIQELSTIAQYRLPIKLFIINNSYMGMVKQWQDLFYENRYSQSYTASLPDFEKLAESFGIKGITCSNARGLSDKIKLAFNHKGPVVFNCIVTEETHVMPMIPAGAGHNEIVKKQV